MSTFHKSYFIRTFAGKMPRPRSGTRTLCEPARSKCWSTFHKSHFIRKFTGKMPRPRSGTRTLCEPARSKCWSTFHKSHFIRKFTGKMPRPRSGTRTLCELAVEMHVNISQESLHTEVYRKNAAAQNRDPHFVRACSRNACQHFTKATLYGHLQEKCRGPEAGPALCASLRGRNAGQHFTRVTSYGSLQEKCRGPEAGPALCASLRGRNAGQHFTRVTSYGSLQEKCRGPEPGPALCASLQSKCMSTFHKSHFIRKFTGKMPRPRAGTRTLCELAVEILYFAHLAIRLQMIRVSSIRSSQIDWAEVVVITKLFLDRDWRQF